MNSVRLYFIRQQTEKDLAQVNKALVGQWLSELPLQKQAAILRLINEANRLSTLFGLRLLKMCAQDENIIDFKLTDIQYPDTGKPYWQSQNGYKFDFNITHSDNLIVVAVSKTLKVGVDAEQIRQLKRLNFKMVMLPEELIQIQKTPDLFFELWSKKEAVVKAADTAGIARMRDVMLVEEQAVLDQVTWYLKPVNKAMDLEKQFSVHLATSAPVEQLIIKQVYLEDLLNQML